MNEYLPTIPHIAEVLALHIRRDNDAKRLITEHILPLMGMHFDTAEEAGDASSYIDYLEGNIRDARRDLKGMADTLRNGKDDLVKMVEKCAGEIDIIYDTHLYLSKP